VPSLVQQKQGFISCLSGAKLKSILERFLTKIDHVMTDLLGHTYLKSCYSDLLCNKVGWLVGKESRIKI